MFQLIGLKYSGLLILLGLGSVGCDGIVGSTRKFDRCGVCDGDNSTCRVVSGIFTRPQLPVGYNMVAHIPKGACNLNITQIRKSTNYLALRRLDGTFILNGNWAISWPGEYESAGVKFRYIRQDVNSLESIVSAGPLLEPVDLLILSQQANPGIKYEYMIAALSDTLFLSSKNPEAPNYHRQDSIVTPGPATFVSLTARESRTSPNLSSSPKALPISNDIAYLTKVPAQQPSPDVIHSNRRRHSHHHYNHKQHPGEKKFYWKVIGYTDCSEKCGGGTQQSIVRCVKESNGATVADRRCELDDKPQIQTGVRCNLKPCPAEWSLGAWTICSETCDEGFQTRTVHCQQRISPTLTMRVADGACLSPQPEARKSCMSKPCYLWDMTGWSQCSVTCGNGVRSRIVRCVNARGENAEDEKCVDNEKPAKVSSCNMGPCEGVGWFASEWSPECTEKCGEGVQNRHVTCLAIGVNNEIKILEKPYAVKKRTNRRLLETETNSIEDLDENAIEDFEDYTDESLCDQTQKPAPLRECYSDRLCGEPLWVTGPWSECSSSCGTGWKSRKVFCLIFARGKFKIGEETQCSQVQKPKSRMICSTSKVCPPRWFTSDWDDCSNECGGGTQRRSITCREAEGNITSASCLDLWRPIDKRSCNEHKCSNENRPRETTQIPRLKVEGVENYDNSSPTNTTNISTTSSPRSLSRNNSQESPGNLLEPNEEPDDTKCTDEYRNCALVVQARLCRYKYYRSVCCTSCNEN